MNVRAAVKWTWRWLRHLVWEITDVMPPYHQVCGRLEAKERDCNGKFYVCIGLVKVEVDESTSNGLSIGEKLRVRHTRGNRAVNIDRLWYGDGLQ